VSATATPRTISQVRVVGFTLVRNEEDVIEASIRHNLRSLDAITVVDHGSDDATPQILASLVREGLPVEVRRDDAIELRQSAVTTAEVRPSSSPMPGERRWRPPRRDTSNSCVLSCSTG